MKRRITRDAKAMQSDARIHSVTQVSDREFDVTSGNSGTVYRVDLDNQRNMCECKWAQYHRPSMCSHVIAVITYVEAQRGHKVSAWSTDEEMPEHLRKARIAQWDGIALTAH